MLAEMMTALLVMAATPQDERDLRCMAGQISAEDRAALAVSALENGEAGGGPGERLQNAALSCTQQYQWTPRRAGEITAVTLSLILMDEAGRQLAQAGIPAEGIERWFAGQSQSIRTDGNVSDETGTRLVEALHAQGHSVELLQAQGRMIGLYLGARVMIERMDQGLPLPD